MSESVSEYDIVLLNKQIHSFMNLKKKRNYMYFKIMSLSLTLNSTSDKIKSLNSHCNVQIKIIQHHVLHNSLQQCMTLCNVECYVIIFYQLENFNLNK